MTESIVDPFRSVSSPEGEAESPRQPFVAPAVQDLGGLTSLTLLGGSL
jgi:hypothetical protein